MAFKNISKLVGRTQPDESTSKLGGPEIPRPDDKPSGLWGGVNGAINRRKDEEMKPKAPPRQDHGPTNIGTMPAPQPVMPPIASGPATPMPIPGLGRNPVSPAPQPMDMRQPIQPSEPPRIGAPAPNPFTPLVPPRTITPIPINRLPITQPIQPPRIGAPAQPAFGIPRDQPGMVSYQPINNIARYDILRQIAEDEERRRLLFGV